jgi:hypothetical protein
MSLLSAGGRSVTRAGFVALAVLLAGCGVGRQLVTSRGEYELYRKSKIAPTLEARLGAAHRYLKAAPAGEYAPEVRDWFSSTERSYVAKAQDSLPHLRAYLAALPDGPSASEVAERVRQLEDTVRSAADRELNRDARLDSLKADLERAAEQRRTFLEDLSAFVSTLSTVRVWNQPITAIDPELSARLALEEPATCQLDLCARPFTVRFAIPHSAGRLVPRDASYELEIVLAEGLVAEMRLSGRELFSRVGEAQDLRPVSFADPQARAEAIGRALTLIGNAIGSAFPEETCARPAVSPVVLERACDGSRVTVTAAIDSGATDVIVFAPEAPPVAEPAASGNKGALKRPAPEKPSAAPPPAAAPPATPPPATPTPAPAPSTPSPPAAAGSAGPAPTRPASSAR